MTSPMPHYQALECTSTHMVAAAQQGRWAEVARLQDVAREQVASLQALGPASLSTLERRVRLEALKAVLRHDAQVRRLAEPGWATVEGWLAPSRHRQVIAYSADRTIKS